MRFDKSVNPFCKRERARARKREREKETSFRYAACRIIGHCFSIDMFCEIDDVHLQAIIENSLRTKKPRL